MTGSFLFWVNAGLLPLNLFLVAQNDAGFGALSACAAALNVILMVRMMRSA